MTTQDMRIKKSHVALMKHPETALYSGVMMMGESTVVDDDNMTAYTNGFDKRYGRKFIEKLTDAELRALVLHENLHVALNHCNRFRKDFMENPKLMNICADYVVNDVIVHLEDKGLCVLPEGGLYEEKYHNWSVREVLNDLKQQLSKPVDKTDESKTGDGVGNGDDSKAGKSNQQSLLDSLKTMDEHDFNGEIKTDKELKEMTAKIENALKEGAIIAGRFGVKAPRAIDEMFEPKIDWRNELRDFMSSTVKGRDEYSWRKFNKRLMVNDMYLPSMENESIGEIVVAIDTSGSIGTKELSEFASELASICETVEPESIRVVWWDYDVHGEQLFKPDEYPQIRSLLKPLGGGGTRVSSVSEYVTAERINAEAIIVFTDGYVESDIEWLPSIPTLWLVTECKNFVSPAGGSVVSVADV